LKRNIVGKKSRTTGNEKTLKVEGSGQPMPGINGKGD